MNRAELEIDVLIAARDFYTRECNQLAHIFDDNCQDFYLQMKLGEECFTSKRATEREEYIERIEPLIEPVVIRNGIARAYPAYSSLHGEAAEAWTLLALRVEEEGGFKTERFLHYQSIFLDKLHRSNGTIGRFDYKTDSPEDNWIKSGDWINLPAVRRIVSDYSKTFESGAAEYYRALRRSLVAESRRAVDYARMIANGISPAALIDPPPVSASDQPPHHRSRGVQGKANATSTSDNGQRPKN